MRKGFREGIKPVSVTDGAISFWRGLLFATNIRRKKSVSAQLSLAKSHFSRELYRERSRKLAFRESSPYNSHEKSHFAIVLVAKSLPRDIATITLVTKIVFLPSRKPFHMSYQLSRNPFFVVVRLINIDNSRN